MKAQVVIQVPGHPPSANNLFLTLRKSLLRVKSPEYRAFEALVAKACRVQLTGVELPALRGKFFRAELAIYDTTWLFKNGAPKNKDIDNFQKSFVDAACKGLLLEDRYMLSIMSEKTIGRFAGCQLTLTFDDDFELK